MAFVQLEWMWKRVLNVVVEVANVGGEVLKEVAAEVERPEVRQVARGVTSATMRLGRGRTGQSGVEG